MADELAQKVEQFQREEETIRQGGGAKAIDRQHDQEPAHCTRAHRTADRPRRRLLRTRFVGRLEHVRRLGRHPVGRRRHRRRHRRRPAGHGHRQRRHGQGRRLLSHDVQEGAARPAHRPGKSPAARLPGGLRRRLSAAAGRGLSRRGRFRPHLSQQRGDLGGRHSAVRGHHGQLRGRRRLSARPVRQAADDRRQRALPRRPGAGQGGHRPDGQPRRPGRRRDARRDQRHHRLSRAE